MKKERIVKYVPGTHRPKSKTDWARVKALTDEEILAAVRSDPDAERLMRSSGGGWVPPAGAEGCRQFACR